MPDSGIAVAGIDVGTECVKVIVLDGGRTIRGRAIVPTGGYFQDRAQEAMDAALDEAQVTAGDLASVCATGFGKDCVPFPALQSGDTACHARGAFFHFPQAACVVDIGGREPRVILTDPSGRPLEIHTVRRCALGIGTFLMFASRHLDVHPTQLQELAASVDQPTPIGSYCSVFAGSEVLDRLREGISRESIALGCMRSIAERIVEIGGFREPMRITGGVAEYFPGVIKALVDLTHIAAESVPEPIMAGALGAALHALRSVKAEEVSRA